MKKLFNLFFALFFTSSLVKSQPGAIDSSFKFDFNIKNIQFVTRAALQQDGKIILCGSFKDTFLGRDILRLNSNGSLDTSFEIFLHIARDLLIQRDGKIVVTGDWNFINEKIQKSKFARFHEDGTVDFSFNSESLPQASSALSMQPDGKLLLMRDNRIRRINTDGSRDLSFNLNANVFDRFFYSIVVQPDRKILVGGEFNKINNLSNKFITRLNQDGYLDTTFKGSLGFKTEVGLVNVVFLQKDGKIILGGSFKAFNGVTNHNIVRLNTDGSLDTSFNTGIGFDGNSTISTIYVQKDGKIILGGRFNTFNGVKSRNIVRIDKNGNIDTTFKTGEGFNGQVKIILPESRNKIIVAGDFSTYNLDSFTSIVRLHNDEFPSISNLVFSVFPNPSFGNFTVSASQLIKLVTITDILGKEIYRIEPQSYDVNIDFSEKAAGLYYIKVFSEDGMEHQKFLRY